jgi:hypothetical protein
LVYVIVYGRSTGINGQLNVVNVVGAKICRDLARDVRAIGEQAPGEAKAVDVAHDFPEVRSKEGLTPADAHLVDARIPERIRDPSALVCGECAYLGFGHCTGIAVLAAMVAGPGNVPTSRGGAPDGGVGNAFDDGIFLLSGDGGSARWALLGRDEACGFEKVKGHATI